MGKLLITVDRTQGIAQLRHPCPFGAQALDQPTRLLGDRLQAVWFHRHAFPPCAVPLGMLSASLSLDTASLPESITSHSSTCPDKISQQSHQSAPTRLRRGLVHVFMSIIMGL